MLHALILKDAFESLDSTLQSHYKPNAAGDGYVLDVGPVEGWALEDVKGLKHVLGSANNLTTTLKADLAKFEGIDPEKAREALEKITKMGDWTPDDKVQEKIKSVQEQLTAKHQADLATRDQRVQLLETNLQKRIVDAVAIQAIAEQKGSPTLLLPHIRSQTRVVEVNGEFVAQVVGADGQPKISMKQGNTGTMGVEELVESLKAHPDFQRAFDGAGASGSGARTGSPNNSGNAAILDARDPGLLGESLEDIASGKARVSM